MSLPRPWMIALAASAALNVFLVGGLAGMAYVRLTTPAPAALTTVSVPTPARPAEVAANPPAVVPAPAPVAPVVETPKPPHRAARPAPPAEHPPPPPVAAPPVEVGATPAPAPARPPLISAGDALSPDSRRAFRKALNEANKRNKPLTQQARAERQAALSALGAPGYDAGEVSRRLASARALDQQARGNVEAALAAFTATLSPQERAALADGLSRVYAPAAARRAMAAGN